MEAEWRLSGEPRPAGAERLSGSVGASQWEGRSVAGAGFHGAGGSSETPFLFVKSRCLIGAVSDVPVEADFLSVSRSLCPSRSASYHGYGSSTDTRHHQPGPQTLSGGSGDQAWRLSGDC